MTKRVSKRVSWGPKTKYVIITKGKREKEREREREREREVPIGADRRGRGDDPWVILFPPRWESLIMKNNYSPHVHTCLKVLVSDYLHKRGTAHTCVDIRLPTFDSDYVLKKLTPC